jgi:hypothetical protein
MKWCAGGYPGNEAVFSSMCTSTPVSQDNDGPLMPTCFAQRAFVSAPLTGHCFVLSLCSSRGGITQTCRRRSTCRSTILLDSQRQLNIRGCWGEWPICQICLHQCPFQRRTSAPDVPSPARLFSCGGSEGGRASWGHKAKLCCPPMQPTTSRDLYPPTMLLRATPCITTVREDRTLP